MKRLFLAASGVFAVIPGLATMRRGMPVPPGPGYNWLFGGVVEALGGLAILVLWANRSKIETLSRSKVTKLAITLGVVCLVFVAAYVLLFSHCVVQHDIRGTAYYPLWVSGELAGMVETAGGRYAAIDRYGIDAVKEAIHKMPGVPVAMTSVLLLFVYQGVFSTLAIAFGMLGFHRGESL